MKNSNATYFCIFLTLLTSCATFHADKLQSRQIPISKENFHLLDGYYSRLNINKDIHYRNGDDLFWTIIRKGHHMIKDEDYCTVELQAINLKKLKVTYFKNDSVIDSRIMKGKIIHGYFELRRRTLIVPAILFNICRTTKFRMGILENGNLTADYLEVAFGSGFVIIPFYTNDHRSDTEFSKVTTKKP